LGCEIEVTNIYEEKKKVKIPPGTQNEEKIKVNREGFYKLNSTEKGNMIITVKVKLPKSVT
jgi:molecular chaperone DnaJ